MRIRSLESFEKWLEDLRDQQGTASIRSAIARLEYGLNNNCKSLTQNVWELKIDKGPGYRIYFLRHGDELIVLLCGGDKDSQQKNIRLAYKLADDVRRQL